MTAPIVVGVSPTTQSIAAVEWALDQARRLHRPLVAVTAWQVPRGATPTGIDPASQARTVRQLEEDARVALSKAVVALTDESSIVEKRVVRGTAVSVLLKASVGAEMLVIGSPHPGELSKLRPSLLAPQLVYKAECPVVVMPATTHADHTTARRLAGRIAAAAAGAGRPGLRIPPAPN